MIITNLLTNMVVLTWLGAIPANTPALKEYAFQVMLTNAQSLGTCWHLDQRLITSNQVTRFSVRAHPRQIYTEIEFGDRYEFATSKSGMILFFDNGFVEGKMLGMMGEAAFANRYGGSAKPWLPPTNSLTLDRAQETAQSAMHCYGVPTDEMGFLEPTKKEQLKSADRPLPYYKFEWESEKGHCKVHVSGITTNIVQFELEGAEQLRLKPPPNYLELLGLPPDTVFVRRVSPGRFKIDEP